MSDELYSKIVCALCHNLSVCESCRKCGNDGAEARMNIIEELAKECGKELPWDDDEQSDDTTIYNLNEVEWRKYNEER